MKWIIFIFNGKHWTHKNCGQKKVKSIGLQWIVSRDQELCHWILKLSRKCKIEDCAALAKLCALWLLSSFDNRKCWETFQICINIHRQAWDTICQSFSICSRSWENEILQKALLCNEKKKKILDSNFDPNSKTHHLTFGWWPILSYPC